MRKHLVLLGILAILLAFTSCSGKKGKGILTHTSTGRAYELLVVIDPGMMERPAGEALMDVINSDVPGLPAAEPSFRRMFTSPSNFDATLKMVRNIIIAKVDPKLYTQPKFVVEKDVYSYPQTILNIQAPDEQSFRNFVEANKQQIIDLFDRAEMNRQIDVLRQNHNAQVDKEVKEMFDCDIWIPGDLSSFKKGKDFLWFGTNAATRDRNFVIYSFPYRDKDTFTKAYFIHKRDSVMKVNIPGAREGMYMSTQDSVFTDTRPMAVHGEYCYEAKGLWNVKGDMMGGPYVAHMRVDTKNHRVIVAEIFVYSPDTPQRNLVKQMEASLYTLRLPNDNEDNNEISLGVTREKTTDKK